MTTGIFNEWLVKFDEDMKRKKRKILLLIDNCSPHNEPPKLECIHIEYFPPNCSSILQPLDQCIIKVVKGKYRTQLLRRMLVQIGNKEAITKPDVKQAMDMIAGAWKDISQKVICNGWKKANLISAIDNETVNEINDVIINLQPSWEHVTKETSVPNEVSLDDFLTADDDARTCEALTDNDIVRMIQENKQKSLSDSSDDECPEENNVSTASQALANLEAVKRYLSAQKNFSDTLFEHVHNLENFLISTGSKSFVQKKITDYVSA
ncbi:tigger transposable element-derived protein 6 [Parasteatoda tepidariorum]|uniref:tigger transposable element-derived protein 6 n=1 Tax=Parasteatoda tepidariorum TaxID=114398 RepID=UPI0039BC8253